MFIQYTKKIKIDFDSIRMKQIIILSSLHILQELLPQCCMATNRTKLEDNHLQQGTERFPATVVEKQIIQNELHDLI